MIYLGSGSGYYQNPKEWQANKKYLSYPLFLKTSYGNNIEYIGNFYIIKQIYLSVFYYSLNHINLHKMKFPMYVIIYHLTHMNSFEIFTEFLWTIWWTYRKCDHLFVNITKHLTMDRQNFNDEMAHRSCHVRNVCLAQILEIQIKHPTNYIAFPL